MFAPIGEATGATRSSTALFCAALDAYRDPIVHLHHPRRLPGGTFSFLAFGPGPHSPAEDHFTAVGLDGDAARIYFGAAPEGLFDLAFDLDGRDAWF